MRNEFYSPRPLRSRLLFLLLLAGTVLLAAQAAGQPAASVTDLAGVLEVRVSFDGSVPTVETVRGEAVVRADGCVWGFAPGYPDLPAYLLRVELPPDMKVAKLESSVVEDVLMDGRYEVSATPVPQSTDPDGKRPQTEKAEFDETQWFPVAVVQARGEGFMRGHRIASFLVYPAQYEKATGTIKYLKKLTVRLELGPDQTLPLERKRIVERSERQFDRVLRDLVVNPRASVSRPAVSRTETGAEAGEASFSPSFRPSLDGSPVEYVIITGDEMSGEFQRLADWQTKSGVSAVVRTVSWVRNSYPDGCDLAETIRKFVQDAYTHWGTTWVLLAGDSDVIPARYGYSTYTGGEYIPTDLYFQCLEGNWNGDGDAYFGEGYHGMYDPGDEADLYPDVWIGRAPVNTVAEATLFIDKTLAYVKSPPSNFVTKSLFFAEVLFPKTYVPSGTQCDTVALDGASMTESAVALMPPTMHVARLYENYLCFPGSMQETKQRVIDSLNAGYGLAEHLGHGYRNTMSVADGSLGNSEVDLLTNGTRVGVLMGENCTSAAFDFNCIGERFILNENGGSVCYLGSTRFDYPTTAWAFQDERFRLLFQDGVTSLGQALALSKAAFISLSIADDSYRWTQFVQLLLGEPRMPIWTAEPAAMNVTHAAQFVAGSDWYQVLVMSGGSPVDSALVCLWKVGEDYRVAYTNASGVALIPFNPDTQGSFSVTVTKQDLIPYEGTSQVVLPAGPFLYKYAEDTDDDTAGLSFGNGDYTVDAGETVELTIALRNNGGTTASTVTSTVRTADPFITFTDSTASFGNIASKGFAVPDVPFLVDVSRECPDAHDAVCAIEARDGQDSVWTDVFVVKVHAPRLWHASHVYFDTLASGNRDGYIGTGEEIELVLTLKNLGAGAGNHVRGKLTSPSAFVTIYDSLAVFGSVEACSSSTGDEFMFVCSTEEEAPVFQLTLTDTLGLSEVSTFELAAPEGPSGLYATGSSSSVTLTWDASPYPDIFGYNVYRSMAAGGPYVRVNEAVIEGTSYYMDDGLSPYTRYFYMASSQDSSSNESMSGTYVSVTTNPPLHENAPFELGSELTSSSPAIVDIDKGGHMEIFAGSSKMYAFRDNGDEYINGDNDVLTWGVFAPEGEKFVASPAVADIDNDDDVEVVAVDWNLRKVYVWNPDGTVQPGWPQNVGINPWSTPALGNIAGDGRLEVVVGSADGNVYAWNSDGTEVVDGDGNPSTLGVLRTTGSMWLYSSAALADLDNDGLDEVIIGGRDGKLYALNGDGSDVPHFPYVTTGYITSSPAVGDVDEDGLPEIAFCSGNYKVYVINTDSTSVPGWPKSGINMSGDMQPSPALGDVDGNGKLDVIVGTSDGYVAVYTGYNGALQPGWPVLTTFLGSQCSPTVGDIDGDGMMEVLFGAENGKLYAWNHDGTEASGFPIQMSGEVRGPALIWDIDDDGYTNVICQNWDRAVYIWDMNGAFNYSRGAYPWPMFRHDVSRSGLYTKPVLVAVELSSFAAVPSDAGVMLEWHTNLDDGVGAQWNVYRCDATDQHAGAPATGDVSLASGRLPDGYVRINSSPVEAAGPNYYMFRDVSAEGGRWYSYVLGRIFQEGEILFGPYAALAPASSVPRVPALSQNFPNPFQPRTTVAFSVPVRAGSAAVMTPVSVRVYDVAGRLVRTLVDEPKSPGFYSVGWDATSDAGQRVAGGIYFIRARIGDYSGSKKTVVLD